MKAAIIFTGSGPILVLTSHDSFTEKKFVEKLNAKGIKKFIAYEIPIDRVREKYGMHFTVVIHDLKETDDLRVLDYDGHHVFTTFSFAEMGSPIRYELSMELQENEGDRLEGSVDPVCCEGYCQVYKDGQWVDTKVKKESY